LKIWTAVGLSLSETRTLGIFVSLKRMSWVMDPHLASP